jgi:hypothetical protein
MAAFTTIAAGAGLAATAASTGMSFSQMMKAGKMRDAANKKAEEMMSEARKKLEVNFYNQLAIQKEPYELEREAMLSAGAQAIEAGRESERGAAATAGRIQAAQVQGQRDIATAMGQEMLGLEKLSAQEESRLRDLGTQIDLEEAAGAQAAASQAEEMRALARKDAMEGVTSMVEQGIQMAPLYFKDPALARQAFGDIGATGLPDGAMGPVTQFQSQAAELGQMNPFEYRRRMGKLGREQRSELYNNPEFLKKYNELYKLKYPFEL